MSATLDGPHTRATCWTVAAVDRGLSRVTAEDGGRACFVQCRGARREGHEADAVHGRRVERTPFAVTAWNDGVSLHHRVHAGLAFVHGIPTHAVPHAAVRQRAARRDREAFARGSSRRFSSVRVDGGHRLGGRALVCPSRLPHFWQGRAGRWGRRATCRHQERPPQAHATGRLHPRRLVPIPGSSMRVPRTSRAHCRFARSVEAEAEVDAREQLGLHG